jgi:tripartite-type tricarboxylate transporter receptor subunit TctC
MGREKREGQVRALAVISATRSSALPGVAEASGHDLTADIVTGFVTRAGTPRPIIDRRHGEIVKIMAQADVRGASPCWGSNRSATRRKNTRRGSRPRS